MSYQQETPFDNLDSALEYVSQLFDATGEAQVEVDTEITRTEDPELARRKQALQLVKLKLGQLSTHVAASRRALNDLRMLRRILLEEKSDADAAVS
jgi:hypothetical protein